MRRPITAAPLVIAALLSAGCSEPALPDGPVEDTETGAAPQPDEADDTHREELADSLAALAAAIDEAMGYLEAAAAADGAAAAEDDAQRALGLLVEGAGTGPADSPVLPADSPEREATAERDDLLSTTLALARDVGGDTGSTVVNLLRDEVAGDLGAWERDAAGMVAGAERAATSSNDLDQLTEAILELPGEATRALAWTMSSVEATDGRTAAAAAERAAAHLELIRIAITEVTGDLRERDAGGADQ